MAVLLARIEYEQCRTFGHAWETFNPLDRPRDWGQRFYLRCTRCATERHDVIDGLGLLAGRRYDYPKDYRLSADERPTIETLRLDLLKAQRADANGRVHRQRRTARTRRAS